MNHWSCQNFSAGTGRICGVEIQVYVIMATPACWLLAGNRTSFVWCEMLVYVLHDKWVVYCFRIIADSTVSISGDCSDAAGIKLLR